MTEISFAKSFLATLDNRPIKLQSDHVADLKTLELKGAETCTNLSSCQQYTLPRYPSSPPMQHPSTSTTTSQSQPPTSSTDNTITITLRSLKSPPLNLPLPSQSFSTSIFELKQRVAKELQRENTDGIKLLYQRKPCSDAKTVKEVIGDEGAKSGEVELGVMVVGGAASAPAAGAESKKEVGEKGEEDVKMGGVEEGKSEVPAAQGPSGEEVLGSAEFWDDLKGWLMQRVRDEGKAEEAWSLFKRGWDER
ncbi:MAG: hypothetical protein Q9209_001300 [Squamulea sp. 1 TL-2023]